MTRANSGGIGIRSVSSPPCRGMKTAVLIAGLSRNGARRTKGGFVRRRRSGPRHASGSSPDFSLVILRGRWIPRGPKAVSVDGSMVGDQDSLWNAALAVTYRMVG